MYSSLINFQQEIHEIFFEFQFPELDYFDRYYLQSIYYANPQITAPYSCNSFWNLFQFEFKINLPFEAYSKRVLLHFYCFSVGKVRIRLWIRIHYKRWFTDHQSEWIIIHAESGVSDLWASGPFFCGGRKTIPYRQLSIEWHSPYTLYTIHSLSPPSIYGWMDGWLDKMLIHSISRVLNALGLSVLPVAWLLLPTKLIYWFS